MVIEPEKAPLEIDADGIIRVGGTRVTLETVVTAYCQGATPEGIADEYDSLTLANVYAVIAFYLRRKAEVDAYVRESSRQAIAVQERRESQFNPVGIRERLSCSSNARLCELMSMLSWAADENLSGKIVRGLRRRNQDIDLVSIQDLGMSGVADPEILEWCAANRRLLLTHDVRTMIAYAEDRVSKGISMPGIVVAAQALPIGQVIDDVMMMEECCDAGEWEGKVLYLPLR